MTRNQLLAGLFFLTFTAGQVTAQDAASEKVAPNKAAAAVTPTFMLSLNDVNLVRLDENADQPSVIFQQDRVLQETRTRTVPVTKTRSETRTRTVVKDGQEIEQTFTVSVPYVEQVEQTYVVSVRDPGGPISTSVAVANISAWDIHGSEVSGDELAERLSKPTAIFLLRSPYPEGSNVDPSCHWVLRDDVLLVHVPELNAKAAVQRAPARARVRRAPAR